MQNAGYEETGKSYLRENIKTYGRFFQCITVFGICLVGAVIEVYRNEGSVKLSMKNWAEKNRLKRTLKIANI